MQNLPVMKKGKAMLSDKISQADVDYMECTMEQYLAIIGPQKAFIIHRCQSCFGSTSCSADSPLDGANVMIVKYKS